MNYELAKQLKDAGFPQEPTYPRMGMRPPQMKIVWNDKDPITKEGNWCQMVSTRKDLEKDKFWRVRDEAVYTLEELKAEKLVAKVPTLSELIEACGDDFKNLTKDGNWYTNLVAGNEDYYESFDSIGDTPEEAVAKLWIKLNTN